MKRTHQFTRLRKRGKSIQEVEEYITVFKEYLYTEKLNQTKLSSYSNADWRPNCLRAWNQANVGSYLALLVTKYNF